MWRMKGIETGGKMMESISKSQKEKKKKKVKDE